MRFYFVNRTPRIVIWIYWLVDNILRPKVFFIPIFYHVLPGWYFPSFSWKSIRIRTLLGELVIYQTGPIQIFVDCPLELKDLLCICFVLWLYSNHLVDLPRLPHNADKGISAPIVQLLYSCCSQFFEPLLAHLGQLGSALILAGSDDDGSGLDRCLLNELVEGVGS